MMSTIPMIFFFHPDWTLGTSGSRRRPAGPNRTETAPVGKNSPRCASWPIIPLHYINEADLALPPRSLRVNSSQEVQETRDPRKPLPQKLMARPAGRGRRARGPDLRRIDDTAARRVCFSKRRIGLLSKAEAFAASHAGWRVAVLVFSECGQTYAAAYGGREAPHAVIHRAVDQTRASRQEASLPLQPVSASGSSTPLPPPPFFFPSPSSPRATTAGGQSLDLPGAAAAGRAEPDLFSAFLELEALNERMSSSSIFSQSPQQDAPLCYPPRFDLFSPSGDSPGAQSGVTAELPFLEVMERYPAGVSLI